MALSTSVRMGLWSEEPAGDRHGDESLMVRFRLRKQQPQKRRLQSAPTGTQAALQAPADRRLLPLPLRASLSRK